MLRAKQRQKSFYSFLYARIPAEGAKPYIPVSESSYRTDEERFSNNKDSNQWFCVMGNETVKRRICHTRRGGKKHSYLVYAFDAAMFAGCSHRAECLARRRRKQGASVSPSMRRRSTS